MSRVSLPQLVDVDWAIIVKKASSEVERMSVPALLVELDIEQTPDFVDQPPRVEKVGRRGGRRRGGWVCCSDGCASASKCRWTWIEGYLLCCAVLCCVLCWLYLAG